jgi:hypothetical protein
MRHRVLAVAVLLGAGALADDAYAADATASAFDEQRFLAEYAMGVQRLPMDGGKIYGWKISDNVTFGRFKGESDEFGFSIDLNRRQRVEITTDGLRWRQSIGGGH